MKLFQYLNSVGKFYLSHFNLQFLRYSLWLEFDKIIVAHDAEGDVDVLCALFHKAKEHIDDIEDMVKISTKPVELKKMPFGKHKWKTFVEIKKTDKWYLERLRKSLEKEENEDLFYTVSLYLWYLP